MPTSCMYTASSVAAGASDGWSAELERGVETDHGSQGPNCEEKMRTEALRVSGNILEDSVDLKSIYKAGFKIL